MFFRIPPCMNYQSLFFVKQGRNRLPTRQLQNFDFISFACVQEGPLAHPVSLHLLSVIVAVFCLLVLATCITLFLIWKRYTALRHITPYNYYANLHYALLSQFTPHYALLRLFTPHNAVLRHTVSVRKSNRQLILKVRQL
jgi:hypothetical protein